jgi:hypothetical protein
MARRLIAVVFAVEQHLIARQIQGFVVAHHQAALVLVAAQLA